MEALLYKLIEYVVWHLPSFIFCGVAITLLAARTSCERRKRLLLTIMNKQTVQVRTRSDDAFESKRNAVVLERLESSPDRERGAI